MALAKITQVTGRGVFVPGNDIDTDRIIPARFMKCVTFDGLGEFLFYDVRHTPEGQPVVPAHPIDKPEHKGATILLSGANFGCGSSREHAPQAIHKAGFRAVIAENFAEIFFGNSTTLGIPCVNAKREDIARIAAAIGADPQLEIVVDVEKLEVRFGGRSVPVTQRESARDALVNGRWDAIGELIEGKPKVLELATTLPYLAA
ncbi:3-isopropylmalate dehydratase, small subunit [Opitutaceae bacterium TAV1]|nr:3-isopropylmalate dehydratase, small subunit [Opitutaceae bacterium TAV1]